MFSYNSNWKNIIADDGIVNYITVNEFNDSDLSSFIEKINDFLMKNIRTIPIIINTYGGDILNVLAMSDYMDYLKKDGITIPTICMGKCMSAGLLLAASGTRNQRYSTENCRFLLHEAESMVHGSVSDMKNVLSNVINSNELYFSKLNTIVGFDKFFENLLEKNKTTEYFFSTDKAIEYGIIDKIGFPKIEYNVTVTTNIIG